LIPIPLPIRTADFLEAAAGRAAIIIVTEAERTDRELAGDVFRARG